MKKDYLFYGAFGIGVIALLSVLTVYNVRTQDSTKDKGVDLNASNQEIMRQADVDVLGEAVTAQEAIQPDTSEEQVTTDKALHTEKTGGENETEENADEKTQLKKETGQESMKAGTEEEEHAVVKEEKTAQDGYRGNQTLTWPVMGDVILPYSMDTTVYFQTLDQYRCNPGMLIAADRGTQVKAVYAGTVKEVGTSKEFGAYLVLDLGNQYEVYYGQLQDIHVARGDVVSAGDLLASVATPSSYYEKEGSHLYLAVTKEGAPVNPVGLMAD